MYYDKSKLTEDDVKSIEGIMSKNIDGVTTDVYKRQSLQYASFSIIASMPRTCPSMRLRRLRSAFLCFSSLTVCFSQHGQTFLIIILFSLIALPLNFFCSFNIPSRGIFIIYSPGVFVKEKMKRLKILMYGRKK